MLGPGGLLIVDRPNGAFPIDFWHGDHTNAPRWHWPSERLLPSYAEVSGLVLADTAERYFGAMAVPGFRWLARSAFNPYLVLRVDRPEG